MLQATRSPVPTTVPAPSTPGEVRRLGLVGAAALALVDVAVVDADRLDVDEQLSRAGLGRRDVLELEHLGPTVPGHDDRAHAALIPG